jgi:pimeloyl-ACP methyl ester carboxylesterase
VPEKLTQCRARLSVDLVTSKGADAKRRHFRVRVGSGIQIAADAWGGPDRRPVLLLHGGGQTRHAWGGTARTLGDAGFYAISIDLRGHGDSDWCEQGEYHPDAYVRDLRDVMKTLEEPVALVGASLGGMISMLVAGEVAPASVGALVLVDVTPKLEPEGVDRIFRFMTAHPEGFATVEEAAAAVAEFLPHRPRPSDPQGLEKNLRRGPDGRLRWHWDPRFLNREAHARRTGSAWPQRLDQAARGLKCPTLLVRGRQSDVVSEENVKHFRELVPHAEYVDVADAAHMVAGDRNDAFTTSVAEFLRRVLASADSTAA